jgi:hypothetical protein
MLWHAVTAQQLKGAEGTKSLLMVLHACVGHSHCKGWPNHKISTQNSLDHTKVTKTLTLNTQWWPLKRPIGPFNSIGTPAPLSKKLHPGLKAKGVTN